MKGADGLESSTSRPPRGGPQDLFYATRTTKDFPTIARGEGVYLWDAAGSRYLDAASGVFVSTLGQGNERVLGAMYEQGKRYSFSYIRNTRHAPNIDLADRLTALAGPGLERAFFCSSGSDAVEVAIQFLRQHAVATGHPERRWVISLMPSYHGGTLGAIGMGGDRAYPEVYGPLAAFSEKVPAPLTFRAPSPQAAALATVRALEETLQRLGPENVLAFLCEPVGGQTSGANVPHPSFFAEARRICTRYGIHLVFDEVISAFRTGRFLAAHHLPEWAPDLVVLGNGLGGGYAPLSAVLAPGRLVDELADLSGFHVSHSFDAGPIACAAGVAVLDLVNEEGLIERAEDSGARLRAGLERLRARCSLVGDVRGKGLLLGIELVRDAHTLQPFGPEIDPSEAVRHHAMRHGLLLYTRRTNGGAFGDWLIIAPPLVVDDGGIDELLDGLGLALDDAAGELLG